MKSVARAIVDSLTDALTEGTVPAPYERITNGGFASGASWTIGAAAWTISGGKATNILDAGTLKQTLVTDSVLPSGGTIAVSVVVNNPVDGTLYIRTYRNGVAVQTLYGSTPASATLSFSTIATAEWDTIGFDATDFQTSTLDDVSLIA